MSSKPAYSQGHSESVIRSHAARTVHNSAAFVLPHLKPSMRILDIGCGPGTITLGFAQFVPDGQVVGLDFSPEVISQAQSLAAKNSVRNVTFATGDAVQGLSYGDDSFDVVYCHQVLLHIPERINVLCEMRRVCKQGGIVACRESDWESTIHFPSNPGLELWKELLGKNFESAGASLQAGRELHVWARQAGFDAKSIKKSAGAACYASDDERAFFGTTQVDRLEKTEVGQQLRARGATEEDFEKMKEGFERWIRDEDGWYAIAQGEVICSK